jgi:hypothetical protein
MGESPRNTSFSAKSLPALLLQGFAVLQRNDVSLNQLRTSSKNLLENFKKNMHALYNWLEIQGIGRDFSKE